MYHRLLMRTCALRAPEGDEGGAGGGDAGGDGGKGKTFTQAELQRIAAKEKAEGERAGRAAAEAEWQAKLDEQKAAIAELKKQQMSAEERAAAERKERDEAEKRTREEREAKLKKERDEAKASAQTALERWKNDRRNAALQSALITAKVIASASDDAAESMLRNAKIDVDEDGKITGVMYGGKTYESVADAAKQFLDDRPHFAQAVGGGGAGTRGGNGAAPAGGRKLHEMSREDLLSMTIAADKAAGRRA